MLDLDIYRRGAKSSRFRRGVTKEKLILASCPLPKSRSKRVLTTKTAGMFEEEGKYPPALRHYCSCVTL